MMSLLYLIVGLSLILGVYSHSWLHCSDYDGTISGQDFAEDSCNGYIRYWQSQWGNPSFAQDLGINYFASDNNWCQSDFSSDHDSMYSTSYPMAEWCIGDEVTLVWPAKNHANYECFNYIPDTSMKILYNPTVNPQSELTGTLTDVSNGDSDWETLIDWQEGCNAGDDGCGFQNCPEFCDNTDGAPCFQKYTVSRDDFPDDGVYTLMWYWIFNPGAPYTTCFEVDVVSTCENTGDDDDDDDDDDTDPTPNPTPQPTPASGGDDDDDDDNNTGDDDDSDDDGSSGSSSLLAYVLQVPFTYTGADYDADTIIDGANNAFSSVTNTDVSWAVISKEEYDDYFYVVIQTSTDDSATAQSISFDWTTVDVDDDGNISGESELCDSIEEEYGTGSCEIDAGEIKLFCSTCITTSSSNTSSSSSSDDDDNSGVIAVIIILILIIIFLGVGIGYYKMKEKKQNENAAAGASASGPQFGHQSGGQTNITYAS